MSRGKSRKADRKKAARAAGSRRSEESQTADAATVAWTLAASTVLLCNLGVVVGHLLAVNQPDARGPAMLRELLLFAGAVVGLITLVLVPVVYRVRRVPPPTGFTVFAVCAAVAPMLGLAVRAFQ